MNDIDNLPEEQTDDINLAKFTRLYRIEKFLDKNVEEELIKYLTNHDTKIYGEAMFAIIIRRILYKHYGKLTAEYGNYLEHLLVRTMISKHYDKRIIYFKHK